ncbi:MAG: diguanylate cyclase [Gallionella sp.]|jgi:diguanylate cyclase (GGDEF)-like protein/PAS domain S-box-containing protein|nr:diguanylate cyclase [Gallionella sp.]
MALLPDISASLLAKAVDQSVDGIIIADARKPDLPLVYVNVGFEKMTGYSSREVLGKNCRFLQGEDRMQPSIEVVREAVKNGESCVVMLRNFRKDGSLFWNEFNMSPVRDNGGVVTHFIGVLKDVTARVEMLTHLRQSKLALQNANHQLSILALTDSLTGIGNRRYFDEQFQSLLSMAQRGKAPLAVLMIDLDHFKRYNDLYGHQAGDDCLRQVGGCIADSFQRPGDCAARYGGEEFAVISIGMSADELQQHAQQLCDKVRALNLAHLDSPCGVVTVSVGGVARIPTRDTLVVSLLKAADKALYQAKQRGRNRVVIS